MTGLLWTRWRARLAVRCSSADAGFTLIEVVIALALSSIVAGVTVSAMLTSMNVVDVTTEQIADSTDAGLIAAWFTRDAQAAGGSSPSTGTTDTSLGVSVTDDVPGWQGCTQSGALVARFSWIDRVAADRSRAVVVTYALDGSQLTRRACADDGGGPQQNELVLGEHLVTAVARCAPIADCSGTPETISLQITGSGTRVPADHMFTAALRSSATAVPDSTTTMAAPLVVLGGTSSCPPLQLAGTGLVHVLGDAVLDDSCGSTAVGGDPTRLRPTGIISEVPAGIGDPLDTLPSPAPCTGATNPSPIGSSPSPTADVVYPLPVVVTGATHFEPGRHVFCAGVTFDGTAVADGTDVTFVVDGGAFTVMDGAQLQLAAPATGPSLGVLWWVRGTDAATLHFGGVASALRGLIYAPAAPLSITSDLAVSIVGVVAAEATIEGAGPVRLGLPIPTITLAPGALPDAQVGVAYAEATFAASGGTAPYRFVASGLPGGLSLAADGTLSGTPTAAGTFDVRVTAIDATAGASTRTVTLVVVAPATIAGPAALPNGVVGSAYATTSMSASGGSAPLAWSATGLPPGVTMSPSGVVSGTPTTAGTFTPTITLTDAMGVSVSQGYTVTIGTALTVTGPAALPDGQVGVSYPSTTMTASGGAPPYVWSATGLPPGVTMSMAGVVSGTPTSAGTFDVVAYTSDGVGTFAVHSYTVVISPAGPPAPPGCATSPAGWWGEYFSNRTLTGPSTMCRDDAAINFNWGTGGPGGSVPTNNFSVRWTRTQAFTAGTYRFTVGSDDGSRLYIDGVLVGDWWYDTSYVTRSVSQVLSAGPHTIVMEYYENGGDAHATLAWAEIVPAVCPATVSGWKAEYFDNRTLTPPATVCRDDAAINVDWGSGGPGGAIPNDDFSVRWTRTQAFAAGTYTFTVGSDDGARLYIDGVLVGDWWYDTSYVTRTVTRSLTAGSHTVVMEFYERGGVARATLSW